MVSGMGIVETPNRNEMQNVQGKVRIDVLEVKGLSVVGLSRWLEEWIVPEIPATELIPNRESGRIMRTLYSSNLIVATGRAYLGLLLKGSTPAPTHVAVGTSVTVAADGQTALVSEVFRDNITQRINITDGARIRFLLSSTSANGVDLAEAGLFGPSFYNYMLSRVTYTPITKTSSVAINYTWDITFSQP